MRHIMDKQERRIIIFGLLVCIGLFGGCSSLPKKVELRSEVFAAMKMRLGRVAQQQQDYLQALALYGEAYNYYTGIDDMRGKIESGLAIARQYFYLDKVEETEKWIGRVSLWIDSGLPQMVVERSLLWLEMAFAQEDYARVLALGAGITTGNLEYRLEIDCYVLVAKAKLKQNYRGELIQVEAGVGELYNLFEKRKLEDPEVLALVFYHLGYVYRLEENWGLALSYFQKAKMVDSRIDNARGVGKDLYAMGWCYEKLGEVQRARSCYMRVEEIFTLLKDEDMVQKVRQKLTHK